MYESLQTRHVNDGAMRASGIAIDDEAMTHEAMARQPR